jgi:hypothetical protein
MIRFTLAAGLTCLLVLPAAAQDVENVTVSANAVPGIWKITHPHSLTKAGVFGEWKWGQPRESFCRIEQAGTEMAFHCLSMGNGTVTISGNHIHLAWGSMMARLVIDGEFQSGSSFAGHSAAKLAGISIEDPAISSGARIATAADVADKGGKSNLLRTVVSDLTLVPHSPAVKDSAALPAALGRAETFVYLGQQAFDLPGRKAADALTVYAVEFDNGERICGLHQRDDGMLDEFRCA